MPIRSRLSRTMPDPLCLTGLPHANKPKFHFPKEEAGKIVINIRFFLVSGSLDDKKSGLP